MYKIKKKDMSKFIEDFVTNFPNLVHEGIKESLDNEMYDRATSLILLTLNAHIDNLFIEIQRI